MRDPTWVCVLNTDRTSLSTFSLNQLLSIFKLLMCVLGLKGKEPLAPSDLLDGTRDFSSLTDLVSTRKM